MAKLKGKAKEDVVPTKNKFDALEVEKIQQQTLRIIDVKGADKSKEKEKIQLLKESKSAQEKEKVNNAGNSNL